MRHNGEGPFIDVAIQVVAEGRQEILETDLMMPLANKQLLVHDAVNSVPAYIEGAVIIFTAKSFCPSSLIKLTPS